MSESLTILTDVRVAGPPSFFPDRNPANTADPQHYCMVNVIKNNGKNSDGSDRQSETYSCIAWRNMALIVAAFLSIGKQVNIIGRLAHYNKPLGVDAGGKKQYDNRYTLNITSVDLGQDSAKITDLIIADNAAGLAMQAGKFFQSLENTGKLPAGTCAGLGANNVLQALYSPKFMNTAVLLANPNKPQKIPFTDAAVVAGMFGNAKVFERNQAAGTTYPQPGAATAGIDGMFEQAAAEHGVLAAETAGRAPNPAGEAAAHIIGPAPGDEAPAPIEAAAPVGTAADPFGQSAV